jgi:basic membrane protein A
VALISVGADVIYQWLDNAAPAVLQTASDKGIFVIGNTVDQQAVAPKAVLTSMVKRIDIAIASIAQMATNKQLKGEIYSFGWEKPDILYLGKFGDMVPKTVQAKAIQIKEAIVNKKITIT